MSGVIREFGAMVRHAQEHETPLCAVRTPHLAELVDTAERMEIALLTILFDPGPSLGLHERGQDRFPALVAYRALGGRIEDGWMIDRDQLALLWAAHQAKLQMDAEAALQPRGDDRP
jgi:hypothetical protein